MKIYALRRSISVDCAEVAPIEDDIGYDFCASCGYYIDYPKPARRIVEWLEGSDKVCSFVWPARLVAEVLVTEAVRETLEGCGVEFLPVEFYQDPKYWKPKRVTKRTRPRIWLPYEGPPLCVLWVPTWVHADLERSSLRLVSECPVCGHRVYEVEGIEERTHRYDPVKNDLVELHWARQPGKGIFVREEDLEGVEIFRLFEQPGRILCSERVKTLIEERGFCNVTFLEVGDILPASGNH